MIKMLMDHHQEQQVEHWLLLLDFVTFFVLYFAYQVPHNLYYWRYLGCCIRSKSRSSAATIHGPPRKDSCNSIDESYKSAESASDDDDQSVGRATPPPPLHGDDDDDDEKWLLQQVPDSTLAERRRFLLSSLPNKEQAAKNLRAYLEWRTHHYNIEENIMTTVKSTGDDDWDVWNKACAIAIKKDTTVATAVVPEEENTDKEKTTSTIQLPRVIRTHYTLEGSTETEVCDVNGQRIFHIIPGQMDSTLASFSTYALAIALYFEFKLQRDSNECITLVVDARGGRGWPNPHATKLLPFIQEIVTMLLTLFPERLGRSIVFPVPYCFCWIWNLIQTTCISNVATRQKICLLTGPARIASPPPLQEMYPRYMSETTALLLEQQRVAAFKDNMSLSS